MGRAYANIISGEITTELKILQLAENDSQVATFISHEMSHLLKSHSMDVTMPEYVAADLKKRNIELSGVKELAEKCYLTKNFAGVDLKAIGSVLKNSIKGLEKSRNAYNMSRMQELLFGGRSDINDLSNCRKILKTERSLSSLFAKADIAITNHHVENLDKYQKAKNAFLN